MSVPVPDRVFKKNRIFQKGMLVPANTAVEEGVALFGKVDSEKVEDMHRNRMCQICGRRIAKDDWVVFPGGLSDFRYKEAPGHIECIRYAMQVCPHILRRRANMGFSVCKQYVYVPCEAPDWNDPGSWPEYDGIKDWEIMALSMAHSDPVKNDHGDLVCPECGMSNMGMMTYDEFMRWSV